MTEAYRYPARLSSTQTLTVLSYGIELIDAQSANGITSGRLKYLNTQHQCSGLSFLFGLLILYSLNLFSHRTVSKTSKKLWHNFGIRNKGLD